MNELQTTVPEAEIIPAGHVFNAVLDRVHSPGGIPGLTSTVQLIGDGVHATNSGGYLAGITAYAVMYGSSPTGLGYKPAFSDVRWGYVLPSSAVPIVQDIAWSISSAMRNPKAAKFHNLAIQFDVNNDGEITPIDVLIPINYLSRNGSSQYLGNVRSITGYVGVDGDNFASPIDVLYVINRLNRRSESNTNGEGESFDMPDSITQTTSIRSRRKNWALVAVDEFWADSA